MRPAQANEMIRTPTMLIALSLTLTAGDAFAQWHERLAAARELIEESDASAARSALAPIAAQRDDLRVAATARYLIAVIDDEAYRFAEALEGYRALVAMDPGSRYAGRAAARVEELSSHGEGAFAPLRALERVRRTPALADDPRALERLAAEARRWPGGPVRAEARYLVAEAFATRLARPQDAVTIYREIVRDPTTPATMRDLGAQRLVELGVTLGREDRAAQELAGAGRVDPEVLHLAAVHLRRRRLRHVAWALLGITSLWGAVAAARSLRGAERATLLRAWRRPLPLAHLALLSMGGAALAKLSDGHDIGPFVVLGVGATWVYLALTAVAARGSRALVVRGLRGLVGLLAVLAVAFLAMESQDVMMLEGIGL